MSKVLIVDDEQTNLNLLRLVLRKEGFTIIEALNGLDGLTLALVEAPDVIVLDMMLPDIPGEGFCTRLRSTPAIARIPILVLSARAAPADKDRAMAAGANIYMTKPANFTTLVDELYRLITVS